MGSNWSWLISQNCFFIPNLTYYLHSVIGISLFQPQSDPIMRHPLYTCMRFIPTMLSFLIVFFAIKLWSAKVHSKNVWKLRFHEKVFCYLAKKKIYRFLLTRQSISKGSSFTCFQNLKSEFVFGRNKIYSFLEVKSNYKICSPFSILPDFMLKVKKQILLF